jgi:hypothetical protein
MSHKMKIFYIKITAVMAIILIAVLAYADEFTKKDLEY